MPDANQKRQARTRNSKGEGRKTTDVDHIVGKNVKILRKNAGYTQQQLGAAIGLSFKQVRKYETGENRVSASVLHDIARTLDHPVEAFYEGLPLVKNVESVIDKEEAEELASILSNIKKKHERQTLIKLVNEIGDSPLFSA